MADELFGHDKARLRHFCRFMENIDLPWRGSFRVDDIDEERTELLKEGNCKMIGLGLENADNRILSSMKKHVTIEQIEHALKVVYKSHVPFSGNFLFGDIAETVDTATNTLQWWLNHLHYNINLWMVVSYPGSHLYRYARKQGIISDPIKYLEEGCPAVNVSRLDKSEISWLVRQLLELPYEVATKSENVEVLSTSPSEGRMTVRGNCAQCGARNTWVKIRPFISVDLACEYCGQKHNTPFPQETKRSVVKSVEEILNRFDKVAVWGITSYSLSLFRECPVFQDDRIIAIDNASAKQMMDLYGKSVLPPAAIGGNDVPAVIVFYPNSMQQISAQIWRCYPCVQEIIDVCGLIHVVARKAG